MNGRAEPVDEEAEVAGSAGPASGRGSAMWSGSFSIRIRPTSVTGRRNTAGHLGLWSAAASFARRGQQGG